MKDVSDLREGLQTSFSWVDYSVFGGMLVASLVIGIYYAVRNRHKTNEEFILGSRGLSCVPVSMSLVASYISAILILGGPAESYYHNVEWWVGLSGQLAMPVSSIVFMPFFYKLQITSVNQYLEMRYDSRAVRLVASGMYIVMTLLYEAVAIYAPALALAAVTELRVWVSILTVGVIASLYTSIGGLKAVVWTDVVQLTIVIAGMITIIVKGVADAGGLETVWTVAVAHNRTGTHIFKLGFDLYERHTVANIVVGAFIGSLSAFACSQTAVQRYSSMKSLNHAYMSTFLVIPFYVVLISLAAFTGLVLFVTYEGCDPLAAGLISKKDQIVPFYVMDRLSSIPGLPGLFVACIFSGALSTISSAVSSQSAITWEDWLSHTQHCSALSTSTQTLVTKILALGYGVLAVGLSFLAGSLGGVLQTAVAVTNSVGGPLLALFIMALFMPFTNAKSVSVAVLLGTVVSLSFCFGASAIGLKAELLPTSTDACPTDLDIPPPSTDPPIRASDLEYPEKILALSYIHMSTLGFLVTMAAGILLSVLTGGGGGRRLKRSLVHPWVRWAVPDPDEVTARVKALSYDNTLTTKC